MGYDIAEESLSMCQLKQKRTKLVSEPISQILP